MEKQRLLIVGDWVVDEHWVTGIHRSPTSSRTGKAHHRALHNLNSSTRSFCAAGRTASMLFAAQNNGQKVFDIIGIGVWHQKDTNVLASMVDASAVKGHNPYCLHHEYPPPPEGVKLINLADYSISERQHAAIHDRFGTTRVMRIYQQIGSEIELIQRIDWELRSHHENVINQTDFQKLEASDDFANLNSIPPKAVVINDICKGVVTPELIDWLAKKFCDMPWFISTKESEPKWLNKLKSIKVNLVLLHQVAAQRAIRNNQIACWITRNGQVTKDSLSLMDKAYNTFKKPPYLLVMPEGLQLIARCKISHKIEMIPQPEDSQALRPSEEVKGLLQKEVEPVSMPVKVPIASVFFPTIIALGLFKDGSISDEWVLKKSLTITQEWMSHEASRVQNPINWDPSEEIKILIEYPKNKESDDSMTGVWDDFKWKDICDEWNNAFTDTGVIDNLTGQTRKTLQLWRAMGEVDGYVCCVHKKKEVLRKVTQEVESFKQQTRKQHMSCMLIASPGSGKTYLVSKLARSLGMRFLSFNITQMLTKSDILDCFDTIATTQAQNKGDAFIVFFDEINARLDNQHVYDIFLAPLEEGVYIRAGKTFHLDPCFWFFAGTEHPTKAESSTGKDKSNKASDFLSRITIGPLQLVTEGEDARLEKVYLGVSLLRKHFPDVRKISQKVLRTFHSLRPNLEVRDVEHFVSSFSNIQYGEVIGRNVSTAWIREHQNNEVNLKDWEKWEEGDLIEIE